MEEDLDLVRCQMAKAVLAVDFEGLKTCANNLFTKIQTLSERMAWLQTEHERVVHEWVREETHHQNAAAAARAELDQLRAELDRFLHFTPNGETHTVDIDNIILTFGTHASRDEGVNLMEAVAWHCGDAHTDTPVSVSSTLRTLGKNLSDLLPHNQRQQLKKCIPMLVGTAHDGYDPQRICLALDWLIRICAPVWLQLAGFRSKAYALQNLDPIVNERTATAGKAAIYDAMHAVAEETGIRWATVDDSLLSTPSKVRLEEALQLSTGWIVARGDPQRAVKFFAWLVALDKGYLGLDRAIAEIQTLAIQLYESMIKPERCPG